MKPVAYLVIRGDPHYRADAFRTGLRRVGYEVRQHPDSIIRPEDVFVSWNRYGRNHYFAERFEQAGARVIIAENGALGRDAPGGPWYSITLDNPLAAGRWPVPLNDRGERWRSISAVIGARICEWRKPGNQFIILAQRGIGPPGVAEPDGWHRRVAEKLRANRLRCRIRAHPGEKIPASSLEDDLRDAQAVITWASGAAFKALLAGVPVAYGCEKWVGRDAATPLREISPELKIRFPERLPTFQRLAWSMWQTLEIADGAPFRHLLSA